MCLPLMRSSPVTVVFSFTLTLLMEIEFSFKARRASPLEAKNPVCSERKSMMGRPDWT